jgi:hypothetical protein
MWSLQFDLWALILHLDEALLWAFREKRRRGRGGNGLRI